MSETLLSSFVYGVRINKSNLDELEKTVKTAKLPESHYFTSEGKRPLREGDFAVVSETNIALPDRIIAETLVVTAIFSKSQFGKNFPSAKRVGPKYPIDGFEVFTS